MNFDNITLAELKQLAPILRALEGQDETPSVTQDAPVNNAPYWAVGNYCLVRSSQMGCFAGVVESVEAPNADGTRNVILRDARQLWRWWCKEGVGLAGVAATGLQQRSEVRVGPVVEREEVTACGQIISAADDAQKCITEYPVTQG